MIIKLYVNITFFNGEYILVYSKHKFKISSPTINQKFIKCLRDNDIKIVDNYTVEKDNCVMDNELILYVTDKMANNIFIHSFYNSYFYNKFNREIQCRLH